MHERYLSMTELSLDVLMVAVCRYEVMKSQMEKKLLRIVEEQYPLTKGRVTHVSSGTPMTNNFYLGSINGEVLIDLYDDIVCVVD